MERRNKRKSHLRRMLDCLGVLTEGRDPQGEGKLQPGIILGRIDSKKNYSLCILRVQSPAHPCGWSQRPSTNESNSVVRLRDYN